MLMCIFVSCVLTSLMVCPSQVLWPLCGLFYASLVLKSSHVLSLTLGSQKWYRQRATSKAINLGSQWSVSFQGATSKAINLCSQWSVSFARGGNGGGLGQARVMHDGSIVDCECAVRSCRSPSVHACVCSLVRRHLNCWVCSPFISPHLLGACFGVGVACILQVIWKSVLCVRTCQCLCTLYS